MTNQNFIPCAQVNQAQRLTDKRERSKLAKLAMIAAILFLVLNLGVPLMAQVMVSTAPRAEISLNGIWSYVLNQAQSPIPSSGWQTTRIPEIELTGDSSVWYKRTINVPTSWMQPGRSFFIELEKAGHYSAVYCNDTYYAENYGQFSPFEVDITPCIVGGQDNEIEIYVHKADTTYVRSGLNLNQSSCPPSNPDCMGNAYRGSAPTVSQRNWVGLVGDITFSWRPTENVSDVAIVTSVRNWTMQANITVTGGDSQTTVQATVLDGSNPVLTLPAQPVVSGTATLSAPWSTPVLWGPAPYGQPKLYMLQTQLLEAGVAVDTIYTRFGFREVWISGKEILLNGQPLWMYGNFFGKLSPVRYINDRRPEAYWLWILEQSGMNMIESHWDDPGRPFLDLADEMGIMVIGAFYCDGRPAGQSEVDSVTGWTDWMASTASTWVQARRNHPSIIMWRPTDALPQGVTNQPVYKAIAAAVQPEDPQNRPIVDTGEVYSWVQTIQSSENPQECDNGQAMANKLASETIPMFTREISGNWNLPCRDSFFDTFYQLSWDGGGAGILLGLPPFQGNGVTPTWFSISGEGNRPTTHQAAPNWIAQQWTPTYYSNDSVALWQTYVSPNLLATAPQYGDYQASGVPTDVQSAFLVSEDGIANPIGVIAAQDGSGTAWFTVPEAGNYDLIYTSGGQDVVVPVTVNPPAPF